MYIITFLNKKNDSLSIAEANDVIIYLLLSFQTSFPGNLHLILVLRPTGLSSTTPSPSSSTDLGFRFSQDDFLLKMPVGERTSNSSLWISKIQIHRCVCFLKVVMLRSVGELLRYIDENHLASDFTAKVEYCQSDWIVLRTVAPRQPPPL